MKQMFCIVINLRSLSHIFNLKPDSRLQTGISDFLYCLFQSHRKQTSRWIIISHADIPRNPFSFVPATVDHKICKSFSFYCFQDLTNIFMRWISPCSAVFIKNDWKILFTFRSCICSILTCISKSSGKKVNRICMTYRDDRFRSQKALSWSYIFHPVTKFSVSKTSAYRKILINPVYFHLPGSIMCNLHSPEYMVTSVFYSKKREIMIYRQRACLPESFTAYRFFCP